jgi:hypothetical protein
MSGGEAHAIWRNTDVKFLPVNGVTYDVVDVLARAVLIEETIDADSEEPLNSTLIALSAGPSLISQWFRQYLKWSDIDISNILSFRRTFAQGRRFAQSADAPFNAKIAPTEVRAALNRHAMWYTLFGSGMVEAMQELAVKLGADSHAPLDLRHVVAFYLYIPKEFLEGYGRDEKVLAQWGFDQEDWSNCFFTFIQDSFPRGLANWRSLHKQYFGRGPRVPHPMVFTSASGVLLSIDDHDNIDRLFERLDRAVEHGDWPLVIHVCASIFETVAKLRVGSPTVQNQPLGSFFSAYRNRSRLPKPLLDYIESVYRKRNIEPLAGHGSATAPTVTEEEALQARAMTQLLVRLEID